MDLSESYQRINCQKEKYNFIQKKFRRDYQNEKKNIKIKQNISNNI